MSGVKWSTFHLETTKKSYGHGDKLTPEDSHGSPDKITQIEYRNIIWTIHKNDFGCQPLNFPGCKPLLSIGLIRVYPLYRWEINSNYGSRNSVSAWCNGCNGLCGWCQNGGPTFGPASKYHHRKLQQHLKICLKHKSIQTANCKVNFEANITKNIII